MPLSEVNNTAGGFVLECCREIKSPQSKKKLDMEIM